MDKYSPKDIEPKWQKFWEDQKTFVVEEDHHKKKFYGLIEFPYPSGVGLHVGHPRPFTAMDVITRKKRMEGYNVLFPIGFDAFGLPTENYAIKTGRPPAEVTAENIANFTRQLKSLGYGFDWSRQVDTTDPEYYTWTQWIFLQLFKHGLAYKKKQPINWCPKDKIGLANEEVVNGCCERCGGPVEKRDKEQWMLAITKYADSLLEGLKEVDYIDRARVQQEHWIGRSEGVNISYDVEGLGKKVTIFTTRPDTNFGATFIALAPDGLFVNENINSFPKKEEVSAYIEQTKKKNDIERSAEGKEKTGIFTGLYAVNSFNGLRMPLYVTDFVLGAVGTGALVGVPGHDVRDFEFAQKMGLEIIRVVVGPNHDKSPITSKEQVQEESGTMVNSDFLNGLDIHVATKKIMEYIEEKGWGKRVVNYKLRDWVFSRQRYWGEPIPLVYCQACAGRMKSEILQGGNDELSHRSSKEEIAEDEEWCVGERFNPGWIPLPESALPLELPKIEKYLPTDTGESPLAAMTDWVKTTCPKCGGEARRETDTMPNWAGSSWYFLRYMDPHNDTALASKEAMQYWTPVDWYNGGMEHTVLHLLYSRFWNQFLFDIGVVPTREPYKKRTSHGLILAKGGEKMSKSKGNVVNPDEVVAQYGADTLRTYIMFMGPFDQHVEWDESGLIGVRRFLDRVWNLQEKVAKSEIINQKSEILSTLHQTIKKVTEDIDTMRFNTAIAKLMELTNEYTKQDKISSEDFEIMIKLLSPFAPHLAEELWCILGHKNSLSQEPWPTYDPALIVATEVTLAIQINGKLRDTIIVATDISEEEVKKMVLVQEKVVKHLDGRTPKKIIYVSGKLLNIVA